MFATIIATCVSFITLKIQKKGESSTQKALKELENGEYETFKDFNAYKKAMREI